jgi:radial spoke head protein 4A
MTYVADLVAEDRVLRRAGYGFGEKESYHIYIALKKYTQARNPSYIRFWGKIFGTKKDYYVIEMKADPIGEQEEFPESEKVEPRDQPGINKKVFCVSNDSKRSLQSY